MNRAIIALLAALLVSANAAVYALAGHQPGNVVSITGCLTSTAKLVKLKVGDTPKSPCGGQTEVHLSAGDITAVTPAPSGGLTGGGANGAVELGLGDGFKLPQGCSVGAVAKRSGPSAWVCGQDNDTQYDGGDFALSKQSCPAGEFATGIDEAGTLVCTPVRALVSPNGGTRLDADDFGLEITTPEARATIHQQGADVMVLDADGHLKLEGSENVVIDGRNGVGVTTTGSILLGGPACPAAARKMDAVVVNPQNGVGSIVGGSAKVFAC